MNVSLSEGSWLVLSDLHIGHQASQLQNVEPLRPLLERGRTIIFNGDTFEMRRPVDRQNSAHLVSELRKMLDDAGVNAIFINGNHDPTLSEINHIECDDTKILITHGDILFQNIAPWSKNEKLYATAHESQLAALQDHEKTDLVIRLAALKRAAQDYDIDHAVAKPGLAGSWVHFRETAWPPWRPLRILRSWAEIPARAEKFVNTYRPETKTIIIGHSHYAGIWQRGRLRIINTGAAMCGFLPRTVSIEDGVIQVRRLSRINQKFHLGAKIGSPIQNFESTPTPHG